MQLYDKPNQLAGNLGKCRPEKTEPGPAANSLFGYVSSPPPPTSPMSWPPRLRQSQLSSTPPTPLTPDVLRRFAEVRDKVPGSSAPGAYHVLLNTLFPVHSNFTVSSQLLTVSGPGLPTSILMFEVRLRGKLVFMLGVNPPDHLRLPPARESVDTQIRHHIKNLAGWLRLPDLPLSRIDRIRS